jgi:hypothetical protein
MHRPAYKLKDIRQLFKTEVAQPQSQKEAWGGTWPSGLERCVGVLKVTGSSPNIF